MKRKTPKTPVARIFGEPGEYYWCDNSGPLDAQGTVYNTKADAMVAATAAGYRYATGSGTYWGDDVRAIPEHFRARARNK